MVVNLIAFFWGLAEATLFFILPDLWLTVLVVQRGLGKALFATLWATLGAVLGGAVMYLWAQHEPAAALEAVQSVPAITEDMIARAGESMRSDWPWGLLAGGFSGQPYKMFAVGAPEAGVAISDFLLASAAIRGLRFLVAVGLAWVGDRLVARVVESRSARLTLLLAIWVAGYAVYFILFAS